MTKDRHNIVTYLNQCFPLHLAESWDNVGLLVETETAIVDEVRIFLTNDLTESVLEEAIEKQCNFIMTYHPNPFRGMKKITQKDVTQRIVAKCIRHDIWVYSPHTACDNARGGVNDWLAMVSNAKVVEVTDETINAGRGRIVELETPELLYDVIKRYKKHLGITHVRFAPANFLVKGINRTPDSCADAISEFMVRTIAVQAGSGISVLSGTVADLYITGEMSHHECLDANARGTSVILTEHSNSERGFLKAFASTVHAALKVKVEISSIDSDPLVVL